MKSVLLILKKGFFHLPCCRRAPLLSPPVPPAHARLSRVRPCSFDTLVRSGAQFSLHGSAGAPPVRSAAALSPRPNLRAAAPTGAPVASGVDSHHVRVGLQKRKLPHHLLWVSRFIGPLIPGNFRLTLLCVSSVEDVWGLMWG